MAETKAEAATRADVVVSMGIKRIAAAARELRAVRRSLDDLVDVSPLADVIHASLTKIEMDLSDLIERAEDA